MSAVSTTERASPWRALGIASRTNAKNGLPDRRVPVPYNKKERSASAQPNESFRLLLNNVTLNPSSGKEMTISARPSQM